MFELVAEQRLYTAPAVVDTLRSFRSCSPPGRTSMFEVSPDTRLYSPLAIVHTECSPDLAFVDTLQLSSYSSTPVLRICETEPHRWKGLSFGANENASWHYFALARS